MIRLFTTWYDETRADRREEYLTCLQRNLDCSAIEEIWVLHESGTLPEDPQGKLRVRACALRPLYRDFFALINELATDEDISIIANTDIFFDDSIRVLNFLDFSDRCLALSRWDMESDGKAVLFERADSQDSWVFRGRIREVNADFPLGVYDCDNKIAWELGQTGYRVLNPSLSLRTYHIHQSGYRSYEEKAPPDFGIRPPFRYVSPDTFGSLWTCYRLCRQARMPYFPWMLTRSKIARFKPVNLVIRALNKAQRVISKRNPAIAS